MPFATYTSDVPKSTQTRVRARYADDLKRLSSLGFSEFIFYAEVLKTRPSHFAILAFMLLRREVLFRHEGLRMGASYLLMKHDAPDTVALPMGMGVKFYTPFTDGSLLIATTFPSEAIPRAGRSVEKHVDNASIEQVWRDHQARVNRAIASGRATRPTSRFEEFKAMSLQEEGVLAERFPHLAD
jgi:hypothetical protein